MKSSHKSIALIEVVAKALDDINNIAIFVGGTTVPFYIPEIYWPQARATEDVDVVLKIVGRVENWKLERLLREKGFANDLSAGAPICRWLYKNWLKVDFMNPDENILGFTNIWYKEGIEKAITLKSPLPNVKIFSISYFLATKLEAFEGRGNKDFQASPDMEDIISVLEVCEMEPLQSSLGHSSRDLKVYLEKKLLDLKTNSDFIDALPGSVFNRDSPSQGIKNIMEKIDFIIKNCSDR